MSTPSVQDKMNEAIRRRWANRDRLIAGYPEIQQIPKVAKAIRKMVPFGFEPSQLAYYAAHAHRRREYETANLLLIRSLRSLADHLEDI